MNKKIRVAIVTSQFAEIGGVENVIREITNRLKRQADFEIITREREINKIIKGKEPITGIKIIEIKNSEKFRNFISSSRSFFSDIDNRYDIFHFHNWSSILPIFGQKEIAKKSILTLHGTQHTQFKNWKEFYKIPFYWILEKMIFSIPKVTTSVARYHIKSFNPNATVIYNGVDSKLFAPISKSRIKKLKKKFNIGNELLLITVAKLSPIKGTQYLITALNYLNRKTTLLIVGGGPYKKNLKKLAKKSKQKVIFVGAITNKKKIVEFYNIADIFVLPTLWEGLPLTMLEAMSVGKPCIISGICGIPEIINKAKCGYLTRPRDPKDIATKIKKIIPERKEKGKKARKFILKNLDWNIIAKKYFKVYKNIAIS